MQPESLQAVNFYVVAAVSTLASIVASWFIWKNGSSTSISSRLLLALHLTLLCEEITSLPFVYSGNDSLCKAFGFFHFYTGLSNISITAILTVHYCNSILFSNTSITRFIANYFAYVSFGFPLITLLPFTTDSYGVTNGSWCSLPSSNHVANAWSMAIFYAWVWTLLLSSSTIILYVFYRASSMDKTVTAKVFSTIGIYVLVTIACWLPRTITRLIKLVYPIYVSDRTYLWTTIPLYLSGILYSLLLLWDRTGIHVDDQPVSSADHLNSMHLNFTWEIFEDIEATNKERASSASTIKSARPSVTSSPLFGVAEGSPAMNL